jgi:hydrogenase maturation protease
MTSPDRRDRPLIIGVGNPLMGDDGLGLAALARLAADPPPGADLLDGGTWGLTLLPEIEAASSVLLLDAIDGGARPGTVLELEGDAVPAYLGVRLSPHDVGVADVLALARLRGTLPRRLAAIGIQPARVDLHDGLSPAVAAALPAMLDRVASRLAAWSRREPARA